VEAGEKKDATSGLPDCLFKDQKSQFGYILEGLGMKNVGRYSLRPFGIIYGRLV
jgi:hypothetical protein